MKVRYLAFSWLPAREIVLRCLEARTEIHPSGQIMKMDQYCPWKDHLHTLEKELGIPEEKQPLYVLYEDDREKAWRIQAVSLHPGSFQSRKALPEPWRVSFLIWTIYAIFNYILGTPWWRPLGNRCDSWRHLYPRLGFHWWSQDVWRCTPTRCQSSCSPTGSFVRIKKTPCAAQPEKKTLCVVFFYRNIWKKAYGMTVIWVFWRLFAQLSECVPDSSHTSLYLFQCSLFFDKLSIASKMSSSLR